MRFALYLSLVAIGNACGPNTSRTTDSEVDLVKSPDTSFVDESFHPEVTAWKNTNGEEICTATLVASDQVIVASHCLPAAGGAKRVPLDQRHTLRFAGRDYHPSEGTYPLAMNAFRFCFDKVKDARVCLDTHKASELDIAVVRLSEKVANVTPAKVAWKGLAATDSALYLGYGCTDPHNQKGSGRGRKQAYRTIWGQRGKVICTGDSGAAVFNARGEVVYLASMGALVDGRIQDEFSKVADHHDILDDLQKQFVR